MKELRVNAILRKLVASKKKSSEQRLRNLVSALERYQLLIENLEQDLDKNSTTEDEFQNHALAFMNNRAGLQAQRLSDLRAQRDAVKARIPDEQLALRKAMYSEDQLKN